MLLSWLNNKEMMRYHFFFPIFCLFCFYSRKFHQIDYLNDYEYFPACYYLESMHFVFST